MSNAVLDAFLGVFPVGSGIAQGDEEVTGWNPFSEEISLRGRQGEIRTIALADLKAETAAARVQRRAKS